MKSFNIRIHPLINEVEARMQAQLLGNPSALIANLEPQIQIGENLTRPTMTLLFGSMLGVERDTLINLAASIEMLYHAKLVHDNLAVKANQAIPSAAFLTSATVLAGDLAFAAAARLATAPQSTQVMHIFSETLQAMVSGEITHMFQNGAGFEREAYYRHIHAKTASLFELACQATAILATIENDLVNKARQFGYEIGMAFQIVQDILDFVYSSAIPGKPVNNNLHLGIVTLPTIYFFEVHPHDPDIQSIINHNGHNPEIIECIITKIRQSGAIKQALDEAEIFIQRGLEALKNFPNTPERTELELLTAQIVSSEI